MHVWADICEMRKVSTFCWEKMKKNPQPNNNWFNSNYFFLLPLYGGAPLLDIESYEPNCLFRYKLILRKSFSSKMKFKFCDSTDSDTWYHHTTQQSLCYSCTLWHCCLTVHLPHWWSLQCLRGGVLLTSWGTVAQGGGVSRLDGGFPPAW